MVFILYGTKVFKYPAPDKRADLIDKFAAPENFFEPKIALHSWSYLILKMTAWSRCFHYDNFLLPHQIGVRALIEHYFLVKRSAIEFIGESK